MKIPSFIFDFFSYSAIIVLFNMKSREDTYRFTRRFYAYLKNATETVTLKRMQRNTHGSYNYDEHSTILDFRRDILSVAVHECLHYLHPDWSETEVLREESSIMNSITSRQAKTMLKRLADSI